MISLNWTLLNVSSKQHYLRNLFSNWIFYFYSTYSTNLHQTCTTACYLLQSLEVSHTQYCIRLSANQRLLNVHLKIIYISIFPSFRSIMELVLSWPLEGESVHRRSTCAHSVCAGAQFWPLWGRKPQRRPFSWRWCTTQRHWLPAVRHHLLLKWVSFLSGHRSNTVEQISCECYSFYDISKGTFYIIQSSPLFVLGWIGVILYLKPGMTRNTELVHFHRPGCIISGELC